MTISKIAIRIAAIASISMFATMASAESSGHGDSHEAEARPLEGLVATCAACHGEGGTKPILPTYPILAGQYANYLEHTLHDYKSGARKNAVMNGQAAGLSDKEIKALSHYFSKQAGPLHTVGK